MVTGGGARGGSRALPVFDDLEDLLLLYVRKASREKTADSNSARPTTPVIWKAAPIANQTLGLENDWPGSFHNQG